MDKKEKNKILNAIVYPGLFIAVLGLVHFIQFVFDVDWSNHGIYPRKWSGMLGVFTGPFLHGDYQHLFNNAVPLFILGSMLFYFYKELASRVVIWIFLMVGLWTWISARDAYHIGASGIVYGLFSFLLFSGFIRKHLQLIALSFFVIMVYGGMVWGIFPVKLLVSFEAHLWGFVSGLVLALYFQKQGPQKKTYEWEDEEDEELEQDAYWKID